MKDEEGKGRTRKTEGRKRAILCIMHTEDGKHNKGQGKTRKDEKDGRTKTSDSLYNAH